MTVFTREKMHKKRSIYCTLIKPCMTECDGKFIMKQPVECIGDASEANRYSNFK